VLISLLFSVTGCGDSFFDRAPESELTSGNFFNNAQEVRQATASLYSQPWFNWNDKAAYVIGDALAGNMFASGDQFAPWVNLSFDNANSRLNEGWRSLYIVVNQSNLTIQNLRNNAGGVDEEVRQVALAEARFMRGVAYSYIGQLWGDAPIVTNTARLIDQPDAPKNRRQDVLQFAINDLQYAAENLPPVREEGPGRVDEWSARGMLARMYWTMWAFTSGSGPGPSAPGELLSPDEYLNRAQVQAQRVVEESGMELRDDFGDLWLFEEEENNLEMESLFSLRWSFAGDTWGTHNSRQSFLSPSTDVGLVAWGGGNAVQGHLIEMFNATERNSGDDRRPETFMMQNDFYPELNQANGGFTYDLNSEEFTGDATAIKKYIIGLPSDNDGRVEQQRNGMDTYMLRLAEVLLTYTQAAVAEGGGQTGDGTAVEYYNRVRTRAGLQPDQDGMITREEVFREKWRELAWEDQNWFQMVRWHMYQPEAAQQFLRDQGRGRIVGYDSEGNVEFTGEPLGLSYPDELFTLPIPENDVLQNEQLLPEAEPVPFDFSNQGTGSE